MKKNNILVLMALAALSFISCGNKTAGGNEGTSTGETEDSVFMLDGPGSVYEPTVEEMEESVLAQVKEVYEAVGKAYSNDDWQAQSNALDKTFCSKDWNATVAAVLEKDKHTDAEIGFFDADYWVMGQDFDEQNLHATDFYVEKLLMDEQPWEAAVTLKLHNFSPIPVRVNLVYEDGTWKVDDLTDLSVDLDWKKSMKEYLAE